MANKTLFASLRDALIPRTNTVNSENAPAYALASHLHSPAHRRPYPDRRSLTVPSVPVCCATLIKHSRISTVHQIIHFGPVFALRR
jgi:hypothetical protein